MPSRWCGHTAPLLDIAAVEPAHDRARTLAGVCMAGHVAATLIVASAVVLLQLLGHVLATRYGANQDFLAQVLVAEPLMLVPLGALGVIELGTGFGLLRWRPAAIPRLAVLASVGLLVVIWSSVFASLRIAMDLLAQPYPGTGRTYWSCCIGCGWSWPLRVQRLSVGWWASWRGAPSPRTP